MSKENKKLVKKVEEAWDTGKIDQLDTLFASDWIHHTGVPGMPAGLETAKMAHEMSIQAMPDRKVKVEGIWSEGDKVAVLTRMTGTNKNGMPWFGAPANDAKLDTTMMSLYRIADGKVVESRGWVDIQTILQQLGVVPPPA